MRVTDMHKSWFLHYFFNSNVFQYSSLASYIIKLPFFSWLSGWALENLIFIFHCIQDTHEITWDARPFYTPITSSVNGHNNIYSKRFPWLTFASRVFSDTQLEDSKENRISCVIFLFEISSTGTGKGKLLIYMARTCNGKLPHLFIYLAASNGSRVKFLSTFL